MLLSKSLKTGFLTLKTFEVKLSSIFKPACQILRGKYFSLRENLLSFTAVNDRGLDTKNYRTERKIKIMAQGAVKWFDASKGYGFILPDEGGSDVFVHISAVEAARLTKSFIEGQEVKYELSMQNGKMAATNLSIP